MAVLVTGGAGYIGSQVAYDLVDKGEDVVVLDNLATGFREAVPAAATFVEGSAGSLDVLSGLFARHKIDAVLHFAASTVVPESVKEPARYYSNNTMNALQLFSAAASAGVRHVVFSSTAAVYGNAPDGPIAESAPLLPVSPYGASKLMSERILDDISRASALRYVVLRYFNVAGADPAGRTGQSTLAATHLIKAGVQAAVGRRSHLEIYGTDYDTPDGTCIRDYIHVCDLSAAHIAALSWLRSGGENRLFNCGYGRGFSVREVVSAVRRVSGLDFKVMEGPRRAGDPASIVADPSAIRSTFAWSPRFDDLDTIIRHALAWERHLAAKD